MAKVRNFKPVKVTQSPQYVMPTNPPTPKQLKAINRVVTSRGLPMPDIKTEGEADRWLNARNMFANPEDFDGYSENSYIGKKGAEARWGKSRQAV